MEIRRDMLICKLIEMDEQVAPLLAQEGMHCIGCLSADNETLEEAALAHGIDPIILERKLNFHLNMMK